MGRLTKDLGPLALKQKFPNIVAGFFSDADCLGAALCARKFLKALGDARISFEPRVGRAQIVPNPRLTQIAAIGIKDRIPLL